MSPFKITTKKYIQRFYCISNVFYSRNKNENQTKNKMTDVNKENVLILLSIVMCKTNI